MSDFRRDIQGLRAIAILLVVGYHAGVPGLTGGYIGVDVFFVLSGYLITTLLVAEVRQTGSISLSRFYGRRARRLLPAMAVMLAVTMIVGSFVYAPVEQDRLANASLTTAAYGSNIYFARASTDYLAERSDSNPLLHTWSLGVEEQFYVGWPLLVMLATGALPLWKWMRVPKGLAAWMGTALLVSFAACVYFTRTTQPWAFFLSPPRTWEFAIGGLATLPRRNQFHPSIESLLSWLGMGGVIGASLLFDTQTSFPGTAAMLPVVSTAMVLRYTGSTTHRGAARFLGIAPLQEIGRLSYSWYLWHWPFLVFATTIIGTPSGATRIVIMLGALLAAEASYRWVEQPVRLSPSLSASARRSLAMAAIVTATCIALAVGWKAAASAWSRTPSQAIYASMWNDFPAIYRMGCDEYFHSANVKECTFGSASAPSTVVLLGDSHAGHWFPALHRVLDTRTDFRLIVLTKSACPIVDAPYFFKDIGRVYSECQSWLGAALRRIGELRPDVVLVSYAATYPFSSLEWSTGISTVFASLSQSAGATVVIRDVPSLGFEGPSCLARMDWQPRFIPRRAACRTPLATAQDESVYATQVEQANKYSNVTTLDMNSDICPNQMCDVTQGGILTYRDAAHLTTKFAESLAQPLAERLDACLKNLAAISTVEVRFRR